MTTNARSLFTYPGSLKPVIKRAKREGGSKKTKRGYVQNMQVKCDKFRSARKEKKMPLPPLRARSHLEPNAGRQVFIPKLPRCGYFVRR
jgi:hypothetical protein